MVVLGTRHIGRSRHGARVQSVIPLTVATILMAACSGEAVSVPRLVAACELEGVRLYRNPYTRDVRVGDYIVTCMRQKGYAVSFTNTPCTAENPNLRDPACYQVVSDL